MNWTKVLLNLAGAAIACAGVHASGAMGSTSDLKAAATAILMCVVMNQIGLHQVKP